MDVHDARLAPPLGPKRLMIETLEERALLSSGFYSIDGTGNNPFHNTWGSAGTDLIRIAPSNYADGASAPAGADRPSARDISNALSDQADPNNPAQDLDIINQKGLSDFIYIFGQFLDHDLDLTTANTGQSFDILATQPGDPFNPPGYMPFTRSDYDPKTGTKNPRQQINAITSFMDGSQIYGSDPARADALRSHQGGRLLMDSNNMLPLDTLANFPNGQLTMANDAGIVGQSQLFAAGDVRANENVELTAMQTLFAREHNRIAGQLQTAHPTWTDEQLYQNARRIVIAELQIITYTEWLPALLGPNALPAYNGYNPKVNPSISNEFSTAMFRFAHSQLDNGVDRMNNDGTDIADGGLDLAQAFFNPTLLNPAGVYDPFSTHISTDIDPILKGGASGDAQEVDLLAVRDIRNLLFGPPGSGGSDLIARDIQRGRDHGLTDYNSMRAAYGLPRVKTFADITSDPTVQAKLQQLYGSVDNIDAFVGALAEDHAPGADVGPLTKAVLVNQFTRLRDGDRLFYLNQFSGTQLQALLANTSLAKIIERNTGITNLQSNVFYFRPTIAGNVFADLNGNGVRDSREPGLAGITVQLLDNSGQLVGSAVTNQFGRYQFNFLNGIGGTGTYSVQLLLPAGDTQTTANPAPIPITQGDVHATGVNFGVLPGKAAATAAPAPATSSPNPALSNDWSGDAFAVNWIADMNWLANQTLKK